ncbi:hypothetical protein ACJ41O_004035 [Fusarium nematophilum]
MRFYTIAALLLGGTTLAAPAHDKRDTCCCCDISEPAIVCRESDECMCPAVMCPSGAPTIWADVVEPTPAVPAVKREEDEDDSSSPSEEKTPETPFECCCCRPGELVVVCDWRSSPDKCVCPAIACPTDAPTIRPEPTTTPAPTPTSSPEPCCCCNIAKEAIVCEVREEHEDQSCICPLVMCPSNAPTLTVYPEPKKTAD